MAEAKDAFFERSTAVVELCNSQLLNARDIEIAASAAHGALFGMVGGAEQPDRP